MIIREIYEKIIENSQDYVAYKQRMNELPDDNDIDFSKNFIVIITSEKPRINEKEKDMAIYEVCADDTTTYIKLKQRPEPNYNNNYNNWYAICKKSFLRENIEIEIDY